MVTSLPGSYPAALMASRIELSASSVPSSVGAKPPSSPTAVLRSEERRVGKEC